MEVGSWVIYYPKTLRDRFPNIELLWQQNAWLGQVRRINSETITVYYETKYGAVPMEEDIPQRYVKLARDVYWYEFYHRKGFHVNLYGYGFASIFFLLFVK
jgi:hypothetical protein